MTTPDSSALRLMPLGDSITMGASTRQSYRRPLQHRLRHHGLVFTFVGSLTRHEIGPPPFDDFDPRHEGHWGWCSGRILDQADAWFAAARPDVLLLHLGTNDCTAGLAPSETVRKLDAIIRIARCYRPGLSVFWARIIPNTVRPDLVRELNALIPPAAAALHRPGAPVRVVDAWTGFDPAADTDDGIHPNEAGEDKLAACFSEALLAARKD